MRKASEQLFFCSDTANKLKERVVEITEKFNQNSSRKVDSGVSVPSIGNLETEVKNYLIHLKGYLKSLVKVFNFLWDENIPEAQFNKMADCLDVKGEKGMTAFIRNNQPWLVEMIEARNACEHQDDPKLSLKIKDFELISGNKVQAPTWELVCNKKNVSAAFKEDLVTGLEQIVRNAIGFGEDLYLLSIDRHLNSSFPWALADKSEEDRNSDMPVRYEISFDISRVKLPKK